MQGPKHFKYVIHMVLELPKRRVDIYLNRSGWTERLEDAYEFMFKNEAWEMLIKRDLNKKKFVNIIDNPLYVDPDQPYVAGDIGYWMRSGIQDEKGL